MGLSCNCEQYLEAGQTYWYTPEDYTTLKTKTRKRCSSCIESIDVGSVAAEFQRVKVPGTDIELRISGEDGEIPRASSYLCERCADLFFSLNELGFCIDINEDMRELVKKLAGRLIL